MVVAPLREEKQKRGEQNAIKIKNNGKVRSCSYPGSAVYMCEEGFVVAYVCVVLGCLLHI